MNRESIIDFFKENVLGRYVKIELKDERVFFGKLECIDNERNLILTDAQEEIPEKYVSFQNRELEMFVNYLFPGDPYVNINNVPADKKIYFEEKFSRNKFRVGGAVVMGKDVKKLMIQQEYDNKREIMKKLYEIKNKRLDKE